MSDSARKSATISPTAHYTGQIWLRNGLSDERLRTPQGEVLYQVVRPLMAASRLFGGPTLQDFLLARHDLIDWRLAEAIDGGRVTQVIEIAAGLSPRGLRFTRRYGPKITYIEADLPGMAARKRKLLGATGMHHRIVTVNALADDGPGSLAELAATLDRSQGAAIVTEGLLNYFDRDSVTGMWRRFEAALAGFPRGLYLADIHVAGDAVRGAGAFVLALSTFVRSRVHLHFRTPGEVEAALRAAGFPAARAHSPADFADRLPACRPKWARLVRVIEASTER
ncbi:MAG: class I SAM-dependent methyltransferase [Polyangiaceae bacterium]|nr:class I SAM-dependent methyltransferase [Polyangiaceae bacterium]